MLQIFAGIAGETLADVARRLEQEVANLVGQPASEHEGVSDRAKRGLLLSRPILALGVGLQLLTVKVHVAQLARDSPLFPHASTAAEFETAAPQAADIIHWWFMAYKGRDAAMACETMADETVAAALIDRAHAAFARP